MFIRSVRDFSNASLAKTEFRHIFACRYLKVSVDERGLRLDKTNIIHQGKEKESYHNE
jgi:hypothetical protein